MKTALLIAAAVALVLYLRSQQPGTSDQSMGADALQSNPRTPGTRTGTSSTTLPTAPPKMTTQQREAQSPADKAARPSPPLDPVLAPIAGPVEPGDRLFGIQDTPIVKPPPGTTNVLEQLAAAVAPAPIHSPLDGLGN